MDERNTHIKRVKELRKSERERETEEEGKDKHRAIEG
jgi:hypothetical protein